MVDKIASTITSKDLDDEEFDLLIYDMLKAVFRIGNIPAGDAILSLFITRIPGFSTRLGRTFSWGRVRERPPVKFLGNYNNSTLELLVECGADPTCVMYYTMVSVPEIAYWEDCLGKGVDDNVLNSLLFFSTMECSCNDHSSYRVDRVPIDFHEYICVDT